MPQKKNPDAAELVRGKVGRVNGSLIGLLTVMKGLPLTYSKDMQEDKEPVFDAADSLALALAAMAGMVGDLEPVPDAMRNAAAKGYPTATDLADWMVRSQGLPFRRSPCSVRPRGSSCRTIRDSTLPTCPGPAAVDRRAHHVGRL